MANKFTQLKQIGIMVSDRETLIENMRAIFGVEPDLENDTLVSDGRMFRGKFSPFQAHNVLYRFATVELEFMIPNEAESAWREWLDEHGPSMHHIMFDVDNYAEATAQMEAGGAPIYHEGDSLSRIPGMKYCYFDTFDKIAMYVECVNRSEFMNAEMTEEQKKAIGRK